MLKLVGELTLTTCPKCKGSGVELVPEGIASNGGRMPGHGCRVPCSACKGSRITPEPVHGSQTVEIK